MGIFDFLKKDKAIHNENGHNKIYESDGSYQTGEMVDGKHHGLWKTFDKEEKLLDEINFKNGLMHGLVRQYNDEGILEKEISMKDGETNGLSKVYHSNGQISEEGNVILEKKDGLWKYYFENGTLQYEGNYKDGEMDGFWKSYDVKGKLIDEHLLKDGKDYNKKSIPKDFKETPEKIIEKLLKMYSEVGANMGKKDYDSVIKKSTALIQDLQEEAKKNPESSISAFGPKDGSFFFSIVDVYYIRGCAKYASNNDDALNDYNKALELLPYHLETLYNRAVFYHNIHNDTENALNDILKCLSLKPDDDEFIKFHKDLLNINKEKLSESEFLRLQAIYFVSCYEFSILKYLEHIDSYKEQEVLMKHLTDEFNNYFNLKEGVVWDKLMPIVGEFKNEGVLNEDEFFPEIIKLPNYHKNSILDLLIDITCSDGEIKRSEMMEQFRFCQISGATGIEGTPLREKWENKIGHFPDVREWDEDQPIKL